MEAVAERVVVDDAIRASCSQDITQIWPLGSAGVYDVRLFRLSSVTAHCEGSITVVDDDTGDVLWERKEWRSDKDGVHEEFAILSNHTCSISFTARARHVGSWAVPYGASTVRVRVAQLARLRVVDRSGVCIMPPLDGQLDVQSWVMDSSERLVRPGSPSLPFSRDDRSCVEESLPDFGICDRSATSHTSTDGIGTGPSSVSIDEVDNFTFVGEVGAQAEGGGLAGMLERAKASLPADDDASYRSKPLQQGPKRIRQQDLPADDDASSRSLRRLPPANPAAPIGCCPVIRIDFLLNSEIEGDTSFS